MSYVNRSCTGRPNRLFRMISGATILATGACAEIEVGSTIYKNLANTRGPAAQPVISSSVTPDAIDTSLRADPESFYATGLALWDGDRTLAGVWIAHPDAQIARQVRLTNNETGTRVDAAMFRRDPNLSGPRIIISSEAAQLLGLAPDLATLISIEGLAYGPADTVVATGPVSDPVSAPADAPADAQSLADPTDPASIEVTPVASIGTESGTAPEPTPPPAAAAEPELVAEAAADPEPVAEVTAPATDTGTEPISSTAGWVTKDEIARTREVQQPAQTAAIPVAATEAPLPQNRPVAPAPGGSGDIDDGRRFIQAGVFGLPDNAARLVEKLRAADLPAKGLPVNLGEKQFTRVVIGPFQTTAERDAALEIVRTVGSPDATPVRG